MAEEREAPPSESVGVSCATISLPLVLTANPENRPSGWVVRPDFLHRVARESRETFGFIGAEEVECVLLAALDISQEGSH